MSNFFPALCQLLFRAAYVMIWQTQFFAQKEATQCV